MTTDKFRFTPFTHSYPSQEGMTHPYPSQEGIFSLWLLIKNKYMLIHIWQQHSNSPPGGGVGWAIEHGICYYSRSSAFNFFNIKAINPVHPENLYNSGIIQAE